MLVGLAYPVAPPPLLQLKKQNMNTFWCDMCFNHHALPCDSVPHHTITPKITPNHRHAGITATIPHRMWDSPFSAHACYHASTPHPRHHARPPPPPHCRRDRTPLPTLAHLGHGPCLGGRSQTKRREADREKPTPASPPTGEGRAPPAVGDGGFLMWHPSHGGVAIEAQRAFITTTAQAEAATRPDLLQRRT